MRSALLRSGLYRAAAASATGFACTHTVATMDASPPKNMVVRDASGRLVVLSKEQREMIFQQAFGEATQFLHDPPAALHRFGDAWRKYVSSDQTAAFTRSLSTVSSSLAAAQAAGQPTQELLGAVREAEGIISEMRATAIEGAAVRPWGDVMRGAKLVPAVAGGWFSSAGTVERPHEEALKGKLVGIYFTASWCGPCRQFSPALVELYNAAKASRGGRAFEVVLVSWDEEEAALSQYSRGVGSAGLESTPPGV